MYREKSAKKVEEKKKPTCRVGENKAPSVTQVSYSLILSNSL